MLNANAPDEARTLRFGGPGEIVELFEGAGLLSVEETSLTVQTRYADFDELWSGFLAGLGPAGAFTMSLPDDERQRLRRDLYRRVGEPDGSFSLSAVSRCAVGRVAG